MKIYIADIDNISKDSQKIAKYLSELGPDEIARYKSINREIRKLQFLIGHAILHNVSTQKKFTSITHKDNLVLVAISDTPIGIDIENTSVVRDFKNFGEIMGIQPTSNGDEFYKNFTRTEALYKIGPQKSPIFLSWYKIDSFMVCIASTQAFSVPTLTPFGDVNPDLLCVHPIASE